MAGKASNQIIGYRYYFDFLAGLSRGPIDALVAIRVGDIQAWPNAYYPGGSDLSYLSNIYMPGAQQPSAGWNSLSSEVTSTTTFAIYAPSLFGGDDKEGGIAGNAMLLMGDRAQTVPDIIKQTISTGGSQTQTVTWSGAGAISFGNEGQVVEAIQYISDFRGLATFYYSGLVCTNNPYPKKWKYRVQRAIQGWDGEGCWYPDKARIGLVSVSVTDPSFDATQLTDANGNVYYIDALGNRITIPPQDLTFPIVAMNPAHIIYQCVTDKIWGRQLPRDQMDEPAWIYAANMLFNEGFGLCMKWSKDLDLDEFIQTVVNYIGATLYVNRLNGKFAIKLIRNDYDHTALTTFDYKSGLLSVDTLETGATSTLANEVIVKYHDPVQDKDRQIRVQNLASIQALGETIPVQKDFTGIPNADLARRAGLRELQANSYGLKRFKLKFDRRGWKLYPGAVIKISAPDKDIVSMVVRIGAYDDGTMQDGTITCDAVQDVFGMPDTTFVSDPGQAWLPPSSGAPIPVVNEFIREANYWEVRRVVPPTLRSDLDTSEGALIGSAARPSAYMTGVQMLTTVDDTPSLGPPGSFCPYATLRTAVGYYDTTLLLGTGTDVTSITAPCGATLGDERVLVSAFDLSSGTVTVARGCADTVPKDHAIGAKMFFDNALSSAHSWNYTQGETVAAELLSRSATVVEVPSDLDTVLNVPIVARWAKPYPMGDLKINANPALTDNIWVMFETVPFTWASRNKIVQDDVLIGHVEGSVAPEDATTYIIEVRNSTSGTLLRTHEVSTLFYTYDNSEASLGPDPAGLLFRFYTRVAGVDSFMHYDVKVLFFGRRGYGYGYGYDYGGA